MSKDPLSSVQRIFEAQGAKRWALAQEDAGARRARLQRLRAAILARREALIEALHGDFRKPATEVELTELHPVLEELAFALAHLEAWMSPRRAATPLVLAGTRSRVKYEAKGRVLILAPWNYPFGLLMAPLVGAIAAGNAVILKPSSKTPRTSRVMAEMIAAAFPEDEVALLEGGHEVSDALLELPFDHIFFTGSANIGRKVMAAAARHLGTVTLELGGKSPALVEASADPEQAAKRILWGKFINAGQTCVAPDYALVHHSKLEAFLAAARRIVAERYGATEAERQASPHFARIVDGRAHARLVGLVEGSVQAGARVVFGGVQDAATRYVAPTLVEGVTPEMPLMQEEIFGPILPVLAYTELDEALRFIQERDKPLALYLFARDKAAIQRVLQGTTAGGTVINHTLIHLGNPHLPFGGVGASGQGNYHGRWGFDTFSHARAVIHQQAPSATALFTPPYGTRWTRLGRRFLRQS